MPSILTKHFKSLLTKQIFNLLDLTANSYLPADKKSYLYAFIGKALPWNSGTEVPPTPSDSDDNINVNFRYGIVAKQLSYPDASLVIPRVNWTSNTVYNNYLSETNFYVLNSKDQVYKCLCNNDNAASLEEPVLSLSTTSLEEPFFETSDGYKWKYMYTISSSQKSKFLNTDWMPVVTNKFVKAAAKPGSIDIVEITNSGNNYVSGTLQDIITVTGDGTGAILKANVSALAIPLTGTANISNTTVVVQGNTTLFNTETSVGQNLNFGNESRLIVSINSDTSLNVNSVFTLTQNDVAITKTGGGVIDIIVQDRGERYSYANVSFQDVVGGTGSGAAAQILIAPYEGHGYDSSSELRANTIMFNVEFDRDESGILPVENDFRQIVLLQNPYEYGTTTLATTDIYTLYTKLLVSPGIGDFNNDEIVYQGTSVDQATFVGSVVHFDVIQNELYLNNVKGTISQNQSLFGVTSGSIRVINSFENPTLDLYSGKVLYINNRLPVTRDAAQKERIRFILSL